MTPLELHNVREWSSNNTAVYIHLVMSPQQASEFNTRVGRNLAQFRKMADLSQAELAQQLTDRGLPFQQQTILKVEKGVRPLKFEEAVVIAELLKIPEVVLHEDDWETYERALALRERAKVNSQIQRHRRIIDESESEIARLQESLEAVAQLNEDPAGAGDG